LISLGWNDVLSKDQTTTHRARLKAILPTFGFEFGPGIFDALKHKTYGFDGTHYAPTVRPENQPKAAPPLGNHEHTKNAVLRCHEHTKRVKNRR
jgi:hypothetical protein